jgi:hypothetical protein
MKKLLVTLSKICLCLQTLKVITKEKCINDCSSEGVEMTAKGYVQYVEEGTTVYWNVYCLCECHEVFVKNDSTEQG